MFFPATEVESDTFCKFFTGLSVLTGLILFLGFFIGDLDGVENT
jgi:hypothetical protein